MYIKSLISSLLLVTILPSQAHAASPSTIQEYIGAISGFIENTLLPFLFAVALLFFVINIARYFIIDSADTTAREKAKQYALYGIIGFVFLVGIWGIVYIILDAFDIAGEPVICPDYIENGRDCGTFFNPMPQDIRNWDGYI